MILRVLGCHGGTTREHRSVSFLIDGHLALDAGSLASGLSLEDQSALETVLITHPHIDHIGDLGTICDSRTHLDLPSLVVAGLDSTLDALRDHFFNDVLWPDFTRIRGIREHVARWQEVEPEETLRFRDLTVHAVRVDHSIPSCGFIVSTADATLAYSGDTGPTQHFWEWLNGLSRVDALITEVSFPDRMHELAARTGHLTPESLLVELDKLEHEATPVFVYGFKPAFANEIRADLDLRDDPRIRILETDQVLHV